MGIFSKIFGTYSERELKRIYPIVDKIEALDEEMIALSDVALKAKTKEFKERIAKGESLDSILPEAFAVCREMSSRVLNMKHYRVQLIGGIVLHQGRIAEMKTGEGKTLVATLAVYLNALKGKGVHVVTVNDYLAKRDSEWMGKLYKSLELTVGVVVNNMNSEERRVAYSCDITYGTNNEFGFDYLRDNMAVYKEQMVQRDLDFAIVDEIDSILIDEARTPLIISGTAEKSTELYIKANDIVKRLSRKVIIEGDDKQFDDSDESYDYIVDLKANSTSLTTSGTKRIEKYFNIEDLSDLENISISHHVSQALRANGLMKNEKDYIVKNGEVIIVDEFTGRLMNGRRYSDGLHQAIEAKEGVKIENESKTLATITFQNYFRMYKKLSGMTGTAKTEEAEFRGIYGLDVIEIPTNKPMIRFDHNDVVYKGEAGKFKAIIEDIKESYEIGQPVLVGTVSIEKSEHISKLLLKEGVPHEVLNAKYHEKEAEIISQAGRFKSVTIATNMAGRGTDIMLGGNPEFITKKEMKKLGYEFELIDEATTNTDTQDQRILDARERYIEIYQKFKKETDEDKAKVVIAGGLKILGTERHESRRIDDQLRGRSGRQGDPGESRFYISLEDDLMKLFGTGRLTNIVEMMGMTDDMAIEQRLLSGAIENAQKRVEGRNYSIRKTVLEYDDVMNKQREIIYSERKKVLEENDIKENITKMCRNVVEGIFDTYNQGVEFSVDWDYEGMNNQFESTFGIKNLASVDNIETIEKEDFLDGVYKKLNKAYIEKEKLIGSDNMRNIERMIMLKIVDQKWMDHIDNMDELKHGVFLRAYGQKDPAIEYKLEGYDMFSQMINDIQQETVSILYKSNIAQEDSVNNVMPNEVNITNYGLDDWMENQGNESNINNDRIENNNKDNNKVKKEPIKVENKVGRNEPCPCGSGKKYKQCCGKEE